MDSANLLGEFYSDSVADSTADFTITASNRIHLLFDTLKSRASRLRLPEAALELVSDSVRDFRDAEELRLLSKATD